MAQRVSRRATIGVLAAGGLTAPIFGPDSRAAAEEINKPIPIPVTAFGAKGDGRADDTDALQRAINATGDLYVPRGRYKVRNITISRDLCLSGEGSASVLEHIGGQSGNMIDVIPSVQDLSIARMAFDGNEAEQPPLSHNRTIMARLGTSGGPPSVLTIADCSFLSGCFADLQVTSVGTSRHPVIVDIVDCIFRGGREGIEAYDPRYIVLQNGGELNIARCSFDLGGRGTKSGRAGITAFGDAKQPARGELTVVGNTFREIGRAHPNSMLGAVECYTCTESVVICGNRIDSAFGRAISCKADQSNIQICNNIVSGTRPGPERDRGASIMLIPSVLPTTGRNAVIANNIVTATQSRGIFVSGNSLYGNTLFSGVAINGNLISDCERVALDVRAVEDAIVANNIIRTCKQGIFASGISGLLSIQGNTVSGPLDTALEASLSPSCRVAAIGNFVSQGKVRILGQGSASWIANACEAAQIYVDAGIKLL